MKRKWVLLPGDKPLWVVFFLLSIISLISVYTTVGLSAVADHGTTPTHEFLKHLLFVVSTYAMIILFGRINYRLFSKVSGLGFVVVMLALLYVIATGGERWFAAGGVKFQPSELAKVVVVVYLASVIAKYRQHVDTEQKLMLLYLIPLVASALVFGANLSTAIIIFVSGFFMVFFGNVYDQKWLKHFCFLAVFGIVGLFVLFKFGANLDVARSATWGHRIQSWVNPDYDEITQENMARMAVARGGLFGVGIGNTIHGRLMTEAHNDFIFAIIIEETGLVGGIFVFALYALFYFRCMRIASRCKGAFGSLCVAGIGTVLYIQAIVNMSVAVGLLPVTGQTLPFISYGGSAYLFLGSGLAVVQAVAHDNKKQAALEALAENEAVEETNNNTSQI